MNKPGLDYVSSLEMTLPLGDKVCPSPIFGQVSEPTVPVSPGEASGYTPIIFTNARLNLSAFPSLANFNIPQTILE